MANALVKYLQLFRSIPEEDQESIQSAFSTQNFKEGDYLFRSGEVCRVINFISKGVLRILVQNEQGNEVTHFFLKENQFCTILQSFTHQTTAIESIQAACDCEVILLPRKELNDLYSKLPYVKELVDQSIQRTLLDKIQIRNAYLGQDAATRYKQFITRQPDIALRVPLSDVASYLGITPQSLSRIRRNMD